MSDAKPFAFATLLAGLTLLLPAWLGLLSAGSPTLLCPLPALTVVPAFSLSSAALYKLMIILPPAAFFLWNLGLFRKAANIPRRSYVLFGGLVVLGVAWFVFGWSYGLQYQGPLYVYSMCAMNLFWAIAISIMFLVAWRKGSSYAMSLAVHWMLFAWLGWYAFPYLGELP